jgi:hypothetical protein
MHTFEFVEIKLTSKINTNQIIKLTGRKKKSIECEGITVVSEDTHSLLSSKAQEASLFIPAKSMSTFRLSNNSNGFKRRKLMKRDGFRKREKKLSRFHHLH